MKNKYYQLIYSTINIIRLLYFNFFKFHLCLNFQNINLKQNYKTIKYHILMGILNNENVIIIH